MPTRRKKYAQMVFNSYERPVVTSQFCKTAFYHWKTTGADISNFTFHTLHCTHHTSHFTVFVKQHSTLGRQRAGTFQTSQYLLNTSNFTLHSLHFIHHTSQFCKTAFYPWKTTGGDISNFTDHTHNVRRQTMRYVTTTYLTSVDVYQCLT